MGSMVFNKNSQNGVFLSSKYYHSKKVNKFRSIYDSYTDNTVIMLEIDRATVYESKDFYNYVHELLADGRNKLIIDMESVYFMDSVFFGTLIKLLKEIKKESGYLKLIVDYKSKPELLSISNFDGIFELYPNLFEAINRSKAS